MVRDHRVFVPEGGDPPMAVVLDFHGLGSDGEQQAAVSGYESLAADEGFVTVHPSGVPGFAGVRSWELPPFDIAGRDDIGYVDELIDLLVDEYCVDARRVYVTGFSNGGLLSSELVCRLADRVAAAVSVAGVTHADDCEPARAVPYMAIHGTADRVVSYDGTGPTLLGPGDPAPGTFFAQVMPDELAQFAADFDCDPDPVRTERSGVVEHRYRGCDDDVPVVFLEVVGGRHVWPGSPFAELVGGPEPGPDLDATRDGWAFMREHALDGI